MSRRSADNYQGTLTTMIEKVAAELGQTPEGKAFVMKALNPSAPLIPSGMPDINTVATVNYNYEGSFTIEPGQGVTTADSVNYQINCHAHPICIADVIKTVSSNPTDISNSETLLNTQLPNAKELPAPTGKAWPDRVNVTTAHAKAKRDFWREQNQHARCTYAGFTLTPTYSSDNNQGLVVCVQQATCGRETVLANPQGGEFIKKTYYGAEDFATFENATNIPRTYTGQMVDGCYTVVKLNENMNTFIDQNSPVSIMSVKVGGTVSATGSEPSPQMFIAIKDGTENVPIMSKYMPQIFIRGASSSTSFMLRYRLGFEVIPFAGSSNTPFAKDAPPYDELAMKMYSRLMLEVQLDGYPASYNLFEWLGDAIRKAAPFVKRAVLGGIGGLSSGTGLAGVLQGAMGGITDEIQARDKIREQKRLMDEQRRMAEQQGYDDNQDDEEEEEYIPPPPRKRIRFQ